MKRDTKPYIKPERIYTYVFILFLLFQIPALTARAQEQALTLPAREMTVEELIREIQTQSGLIVGVNHRSMDVTRKIRFGSDRVTVKEVLDGIVRGSGHNYISRGKHVILVRETMPQAFAAGVPDTVDRRVPFTLEDGTVVLRELETIRPDTLVTDTTFIAFRAENELFFAVQDPDPEREKNLAVRDLTIERENNGVSVGFLLTAGPQTVEKNQALVLRPVLESGGERHDMPSAGIIGPKYRLSMQRRARSLGHEYEDGLNFRIGNGDTLQYRHFFPEAVFAEDARLLFDCDAADCRRFFRETVRTGAENFVRHHRQVIVPELPPVPTTGDRIAGDYAFVEKDPGNVLTIRPQRQQALTVFYDLDRYDLRYEYRDNNRTLSQMIAAINIIKESDDSEITHVVLTGYASPEGPTARNEVLAGNRSRVLRDFIIEHTGLASKTFVMHNGGSDWDGLQMQVEASAEPWRQEVLHILETAPEQDRMPMIRRLEQGGVYNHLLENVFPDLRNAAYIKVYYKNK